MDFYQEIVNAIKWHLAEHFFRYLSGAALCLILIAVAISIGK